MFKINRNTASIDYEKIYHDNRNIFDEVDYLYNRYSVEYTIILIGFKNNLLDKDFDLKEFLRIGDRYIKINSKYHLIIFTFCSKKQSLEAILALEKKMIKRYALYQYSVIFNSYSIVKTKNSSARDMLKEIKSLLIANTTDGIFAK